MEERKEETGTLHVCMNKVNNKMEKEKPNSLSRNQGPKTPNKHKTRKQNRESRTEENYVRLHETEKQNGIRETKFPDRSQSPKEHKTRKHRIQTSTG